jgi:aspartyl-tRNA(Asn)/glutamyl-tRNA(Gln) amidotransferase subunit B
MEEDTGKSTHVGGATGRIHGASHSLLDYNRAGIPLIEIVTKPIEGAGERAPEVAKAYVRELREVIRALGVSEARMEMGQMRCDVNLSLRPNGTEKFGTRSETKNVNSLRSVERAARFEIQRHAAVLSSGGTIVQETRHFHEDTGSTTSGRVKEEAEDYRYFPEPDLVPVAPSRAWVEEIRAALPELPLARRPEGRPHRRRRGRGVRPQVVDGRTGPQRQRVGQGARRTGHHPAAGGPGHRARREGRPERQAGPPGHRGRPRG